MSQKKKVMSFKSKPVKTKSLGEYLRERREQLNLGIKETSLSSQVQVKYIEALEEGRFFDLPALVYVQGFLRSLATAYDLDGEHLIAQFREEKQIDDNLADEIEFAGREEQLIPKFVVSPKTIAIASAALIGVVSLGYLFTQFRSINASPMLEVFSPAEDGPVDSGLLLVRGETEPGAEVFINNQPIVVDAAGKFIENISLAPGSNQIVFRSKNKFDQETVVTRAVVFQEKEVSGSFGVVGAQPGDSEELNVEIAIGDDAAWIFVEADGREVVSGTMLAGSTRKITAKERVVLTTGNAGVTRVFLNNRDLGFLGEDGEVLRDIEFTK